jgi:hypothetical protein
MLIVGGQQGDEVQLRMQVLEEWEPLHLMDAGLREENNFISDIVAAGRKSERHKKSEEKGQEKFVYTLLCNIVRMDVTEKKVVLINIPQIWSSGLRI